MLVTFQFHVTPEGLKIRAGKWEDSLVSDLGQWGWKIFLKLVTGSRPAAEAPRQWPTWVDDETIFLSNSFRVAYISSELARRHFRG
jgi:hypothetical protein